MPDLRNATPRRWLPRSRRGRILAAGSAGAVVLVGAFAAVYFVFFTPESKPRLTLGTTPSGSASTAAPAQGDLAGRWVVAPGSVVGYRVREQLGFLPAPDGRRDRRMASIGLQTAQFPTAAFSAQGPIAVPATSVSGATATVSASGQLTIHGVTKTMTIPLQVRRDGGQVDIAGSLRFAFSDFGMTAPNVGGFVTVQSDPTLELRLLFQHA